MSATTLKIPDEDTLNSKGPALIKSMTKLTSDTKILGELRTVRFSLSAYEDRLLIENSRLEGNGLHPARQEGIFANIQDIQKASQGTGILGIHSYALVSKETSDSVVSRLERAKIKVYSIACYPLSGQWTWRGLKVEVPVGTARNIILNSRTNMEDVLERAPEFGWFFVELSKVTVNLNQKFNSFVFLPTASAMENYCSDSLSRARK